MPCCPKRILGVPILFQRCTPGWPLADSLLSFYPDVAAAATVAGSAPAAVVHAALPAGTLGEAADADPSSPPG